MGEHINATKRFGIVRNFDFYDCYTVMMVIDSVDYDDADADDGNENKNVFRAGEFEHINATKKLDFRGCSIESETIPTTTPFLFRTNEK